MLSLQLPKQGLQRAARGIRSRRWPIEVAGAFASASASSESRQNVTGGDAACPRISPLGIQMISKSLHEQIFRREPLASDAAVAKSKRHLASHGIDATDRTELLREVNVKLPPLTGRNVNEHFVNIARQQIEPYLTLTQTLAKATLPEMPKKWHFSAGWTKYDEQGTTAVQYPDETALVLDVEVCVRDSERPVMATAVSGSHWYSWVSDRLAASHQDYDVEPYGHNSTPRYLIPLESESDGDESLAGGVRWRERVVVGHNVSYDRARIKEQYLMKVSYIY